MSVFLQGPHLFVFNLGDCRCAFLALGDVEETETTPPAAAAQQLQQPQQQQQQRKQYGAGQNGADPMGGDDPSTQARQQAAAGLPQQKPIGSNSNCSSSGGRPSSLGHKEVMRAVCRSSPSLRAALKRAGADASAATSPDEAAAAAAVTWDQRPYTQLLPPPHTASSLLPVSHQPLLDPAAAAADTSNVQQQQQQQQQEEKPASLRYGSTSNTMDWSTRSGSFSASGSSSSSCEMQPLPPLTASPCAAGPLRSDASSSSNNNNPSRTSSSDRRRKRAAITFHWLSRDLRTSAPYELQRLRGLNATVEAGRLGGVLEPSRSIGDFDIKDSQPKGALSTLPEVAYLRLTGPGLLLLASDGFWDFVGPGEILKCLQQVQSVWRPLVKTAKESMQQQQQQQVQVGFAAAASSSMHRNSSCAQGVPEAILSGSLRYVPTAAALSRLSDRLLRRAKRLGSEDDTTCVVAFLKPLNLL